MIKVLNIREKKFAILVLLTGICCHFALAQKTKKTETAQNMSTVYLNEEKIPENVLKTFKKRFAAAQNVQWEYIAKNMQYQVNCSMRDIPNKICLDTAGNWVSTTETLPLDRFMSSQSKAVGAFFPDFKLVAVQRQMRADKNDKFIVDIYENQNIKKKIITRVYLDKTGNVMQSESLGGVEEEKSSKQAQKEQKEEEKMNQAFEKSRSLEIYHSKITESELPVSIQRWISKNYPEYVYKQIDYEEVEEFEEEGSVYQITIQRKGINQPHATIWFTRDGKFLKLDDPYKPQEEETEEEESVVTPPTKKEELVWADSTRIAFDTLLKTRYPRAKDVEWEYDDDNNYQATFIDAKGENTVTYSPSGVWLGTVIVLAKIENTPSSVRKYIEETYPKSTLNQTRMIYEPGQKPYYVVEFFNKKTKSVETLEMLSGGKPKD
jgi:hypothetical protein